MKHLFVIRHGDYHEDTGNLSRNGRQQIQELAAVMQHITGGSVGHYLLSSTAPRAEQTAQIIANAFGLKAFDKEERLFTEHGCDLSARELASIDEMIAPHAERNDIVTITTHFEVVGSYPSHVSMTKLGKREYIGRPGRGEGIYFDLEAKKYKHV